MAACMPVLSVGHLLIVHSIIIIPYKNACIFTVPHVTHMYVVYKHNIIYPHEIRVHNTLVCVKVGRKER